MTDSSKKIFPNTLMALNFLKSTSDLNDNTVRAAWSRIEYDLALLQDAHNRILKLSAELKEAQTPGTTDARRRKS